MSSSTNCQHLDDGFCQNCIENLHLSVDAYESFRYGINAFLERLSEILNSDINDQDKIILAHRVLLSMRGLEAKLDSALNTAQITREVAI